MVAASNVPSVMGGASGPSIAEMWKDAEERFFKLTEKRLDALPANSLEDIVAEIEKRQQATALAYPDGPGVSGKFRDITSCLKLLGGVAAQGSEMVCRGHDASPRHPIPRH